MRVRTHTRILKTASAITLIFFSWSFGPLYAPVAAFAEQQKTVAGGQTRSASAISKQQPEDRFEGALESIREKVGRASEKLAKGEDDSAEIEAIKAKRAELDLLDSEIRKSFAETEKKLQDAKLPQQILDRHSAFVRHYTDNYTQLKSEIDDIDAAKSKADRKTKIEKAKEHLTRVKPPTRHQKLDPNNLPFKARKVAKSRAPRLTPAEFQRDFPKQRSQSGQKVADGRSLPDLLPSRNQQKPVLLAFNGPDSDIPFSIAIDSNPQSAISLPSNDDIGGNPQWNAPQFAFADSSPILLAQAASQPTADDLAETPEIQFTDAIRAKAQELGCAPARLYAWTRNSIEFTPTYGAIQGADMCLQTKQCNAIDTNALLAALMRSCNIPARLNIGTIELPIEKVMNWAGGFSDPTAALNYLASGGIPVTGLRSGGKIYAARLETAWTKAFIDYIPSFGAVHKEGDSWIPLDASYKQYTYTDGIDLQTAVPFNAQNLDQIKATATINEQESYVTNVNSAVVENALNEYNSLLDTYVTDNFPNATPDDILGKKEIIRKDQPILPASLPYKVIVKGTESSEIPEQLKHTITIQLADANNPGSTAITYTTGLAQVGGKRVTISYDPATDADQTTINTYVEQYATSIPAYLLQFKPVLKIEGSAVAIGETVGMGTAQNLTISITSPNGTEMVTHNLLAGDYSAIGINPSKISLDVLQNRINKNDVSEPVGEMLHQTALSYWAEADAFNSIIAKTMRVNNLRHPSELAVAAKVSVSYIWGVPSSATFNRRNIDVKLDNQSVTTKSTDKTKEFYYMQQSGTNSSFLEGTIMDQLFGGNIGNSISAVSALKAANDQGIPIYRIDSSNVAATLPKLQVADAIKTEISNAVNAGLTVQIPQTNITRSGWIGSGYIISNPTDGSGAYRISGGLNGGDSLTDSLTVTPSPTPPSSFMGLFFLANLATDTGLTISIGSGVLAGTELTAAALLLSPAFWILVALLILLAILIARAVNCDAQYEQDSNTCRQLTNSAARARCWASAADRYGACLAGRPLPPLVTW